MTRTLVLAAIAISALAGVASASTSPPRTPSAVRALLLSPTTRVYGPTKSSVGGMLPSSAAWSVRKDVSCSSLGPQSNGGWSSFSCSMTTASPTQSGRFFVRPWSSTSLCMTQISLAACPPPLPAHPLAGDPRVCPGADLAGCLDSAAEDAMTSKTGREVANLGCLTQTTWMSFRCTWIGGSGTVVFAPAKTHWTTTAAVS